MVSHVKDRHCDVKSLAKEHHCDTRFHEVAEKELAPYLVHIVFVHYHRNQLITQNCADDKPRYGNHDIL